MAARAAESAGGFLLRSLRSIEFGTREIAFKNRRTDAAGHGFLRVIIGRISIFKILERQRCRSQVRRFHVRWPWSVRARAPD